MHIRIDEWMSLTESCLIDFINYILKKKVYDASEREKKEATKNQINYSLRKEEKSVIKYLNVMITRVIL